MRFELFKIESLLRPRNWRLRRGGKETLINHSESPEIIFGRRVGGKFAFFQCPGIVTQLLILTFFCVVYILLFTGMVFSFCVNFEKCLRTSRFELALDYFAKVVGRLLSDELFIRNTFNKKQIKNLIYFAFLSRNIHIVSSRYLPRINNSFYFPEWLSFDVNRIYLFSHLVFFLSSVIKLSFSKYFD